ACTAPWFSTPSLHDALPILIAMRVAMIAVFVPLLPAIGVGIWGAVTGSMVLTILAGVLALVAGVVVFLVGLRISVVRLEARYPRSEEHTSELQSRFDLVCRL